MRNNYLFVLGKFLKKGVPNVLDAARSVLNDWNSGKIKYCTQPPKEDQTHVHISASIVHTELKEFDVNNLESVIETDILNNFNVKVDDVMELDAGVPVEMADNSQDVENVPIVSSKVILEDKIPSTSKAERKCSGGRLNVKEFNVKTDPTMQLEGMCQHNKIQYLQNSKPLFVLGNQTLNRNMKNAALKRKKQIIRTEKKVAKLIDGFDQFDLNSCGKKDQSDMNNDYILE